MATRFLLQVIGSGQFESQTCTDVGVDDDNGLGNDSNWQTRPVMVNTNESKRRTFAILKGPDQYFLLLNQVI